MPKGHSHRSETAGNQSNNPFSEFLNPNSMITPGAAGAFTMVITNTLCQQFVQLPLNYTGLTVSFLFGAVVFGYGASLPARVMYYAINSLIIFVVAMGSNAVGVGLDKHANKPSDVASLESTSGAPNTFSTASAGAPPSQPRTSQQGGQTSQPPPPPGKPKFFRQWF
jgi:hypothetical protein